MISKLISRAIGSLRVSVREKLNPYFAPYRIKKLNAQKVPFTIISNNCWAGHVYRYFGLPYCTPTIGLFFFSRDYVKFVYNIKLYLEKELVFISIDQSKYKETLRAYGGECLTCPIAVLGDIEIVFLHYKTESEAREKWNRRKERMNWDHIIYKMSEMTMFDNLNAKKKILFTSKDYNLKNQIVIPEYKDTGFIADDTTNFRKYINLTTIINS